MMKLILVTLFSTICLAAVPNLLTAGVDYSTNTAVFGIYDIESGTLTNITSIPNILLNMPIVYDILIVDGINQIGYSWGYTLVDGVGTQPILIVVDILSSKATYYPINLPVPSPYVVAVYQLFLYNGNILVQYEPLLLYPNSDVAEPLDMVSFATINLSNMQVTSIFNATGVGGLGGSAINGNSLYFQTTNYIGFNASLVQLDLQTLKIVSNVSLQVSVNDFHFIGGNVYANVITHPSVSFGVGLLNLSAGTASIYYKLTAGSVSGYGRTSYSDSSVPYYSFMSLQPPSISTINLNQWLLVAKSPLPPIVQAIAFI